MRSILVASAGLLVACSQIPVQKSAVGGEFVDIGAAQFAVFSQGEAAMAIYLGALQAPDEDWVLPAARRAIERATGCPVMPDTMRSDTKTIKARVDCARANGLFVRAGTPHRKGSARNGPGLSPEELARLRLEDDATK